jgi:DMSO/TMAO reductase YedYZ heme-binding membrane subunit
VSFAKYLEDFSLLSHTNKVLGYTSLQLLAMVYLANVFASIYQLRWKTKYKRFPKWLDYWLRTRKQYGLWAFLIGSFHALATIFITNPSYLPDWYISSKFNKFNLSQMTFNAELNILTGILTFILMLLVALSSINSIANSLNWSEWRFVQTDLGLGCLFVGFLHSFFMYMRIYLEKEEKQHDWVYLLTRVKLIATYLPLLTLLFRFTFAYFKPVSRKLEAIRNGTLSVNSRKNE